MSSQPMSQRSAFLVRLRPEFLGTLKRWAADESRSTNQQIEYLLRSALLEAGRLPSDQAEAVHVGGEDDESGARPRPK